MAIKVGINGFGRIGRAVMRAAQDGRYGDVEIVHINDLTDSNTITHLFKYDSVHGRFAGTCEAADGGMVVNGKHVSLSAERDPKNIPWGGKGVDIVFECTGIFRKKEDANAHIEAGAKRVIISAPAVDEDLTVVYGVNHKLLDPEKHTVISNGSCTTNCLAPVAKVINDTFGVKHGMMTTIHSYTNDQNILDVPHKDMRRARAAAMNMIPTSTGAAKAIGLVLPELKGKIDGLAVRVPTPNVSIVDVTFEVEKSTTIEEVNAALKAASEGELNGVLGFTTEPLVSIDFNGCELSSFVDGASTNVVGGKLVKILTWYDNETGFSWRMLDVAKLFA